MPASIEAKNYRCTCTFCSAIGPVDGNGKPLGRIFTKKEYSIHASILKREGRSSQPVAEQEVQQPVEVHTHQMMARDLRRQGITASLSTSSGLEQQLPEGATLPLFGAIHTTEVLSPPGALPETLSPPEVASPPEASSAPEASSPRKVRLPRSEKSKLTQTALKRLAAIEYTAQKCLDSLHNLAAVSILRTVEGQLICLQRSFDNITRSVESVKLKKRVVGDLLSRLQSKVRSLQHIKSKSTEPIQYDSGKRIIIDSVPLTERRCLLFTGHHYNPPIDTYDYLPQIIMFVVVIATVMMGGSRRMSEMMLGVLAIALKLAFTIGKSTINVTEAHILDQIPGTLDSILKRFQLEGKTMVYAVCPECHCTYPPTFALGSDVPIYPIQCDNIPSPNSKNCSATLLDSGKPIKEYVYHSFHDYLAGLLANPTLEKAMDNICDDSYSDIRENNQTHDSDFTSPTSDAFDAKFVRNFRGPGNKELFIKRPGTEGRYLFALNYDSFVVDRVTVRGASASCSVISAACLNLPLNLRYKPENMYIAGIVPGPVGPHNTELNHYIRPLIDDLVVSWDQGVRYSRTARHHQGRDTRSAIACCVCDLPGARALTQCAAAVSHHYCTRCKCYHLNSIGRFDVSEWKTKDPSSLRKDAEAWKNAMSQAEQEEIFKATGMRWTELWRLPYWDPTRMLVVDPMHAIFEGIAAYHFRIVLALTDISANASPKGITAFDFEFDIPEKDHAAANNIKVKTFDKEVLQIHSTLLSPLDSHYGDTNIAENIKQLKNVLQRKCRDSLKFVSTSLARRLGQPEILSGKKVDYVEALVTWVRFGPHIYSIQLANTLLITSRE